MRPFLTISFTMLIRLAFHICGVLHFVPVIIDSLWTEGSWSYHFFSHSPPQSHVFFSARVAVATVACSEMVNITFLENLLPKRLDFGLIGGRLGSSDLPTSQVQFGCLSPSVYLGRSIVPWQSQSRD